MSLKSVRQAYQEWEIFESEPTRALKDELRQIMENPNKKSDEFFKSIVDEYTSDNTDGFWIRQAIAYFGYTKEDQSISIKCLEEIVGNSKKYWVIGVAVGTAASKLGAISKYPNQILKNTIEVDVYNKNNEVSTEGTLNKIASDYLRNRAYGGYIMTVTGFQTGFDAGQALEASGKQPTVAMAEEFIAKWRKEHEKEAVSS